MPRRPGKAAPLAKRAAVRNADRSAPFWVKWLKAINLSRRPCIDGGDDPRSDPACGRSRGDRAWPRSGKRVLRRCSRRGAVAVQIVAGARIAASEVQHASLPPLQDSVVRTAGRQPQPPRAWSNSNKGSAAGRGQPQAQIFRRRRERPFRRCGTPRWHWPRWCRPAGRWSSDRSPSACCRPTARPRAAAPSGSRRSG